MNEIRVHVSRTLASIDDGNMVEISLDHGHHDASTTHDFGKL